MLPQSEKKKGSLSEEDEYTIIGHSNVTDRDKDEYMRRMEKGIITSDEEAG